MVMLRFSKSVYIKIRKYFALKITYSEAKLKKLTKSTNCRLE